MKPSENFKNQIKNYLDQRAVEDKLFSETYKKENKDLEECCNYIMKCAKDGGCAGYADEDVFGWAVHYYDEDDIKDVKAVHGKVVINRALELTDEEKQEAKEKGMQQAIKEAKVDAINELSETIELNDEDIADAKKIAMDKVVLEQKEKMLTKTPKKKAEPVTDVVTDLFSM